MGVCCMSVCSKRNKNSRNKEVNSLQYGFVFLFFN